MTQGHILVHWLIDRSTTHRHRAGRGPRVPSAGSQSQDSGWAPDSQATLMSEKVISVGFRRLLVGDRPAKDQGSQKGQTEVQVLRAE